MHVTSSVLCFSLKCGKWDTVCEIWLHAELIRQGGSGGRFGHFFVNFSRIKILETFNKNE